MSSSSKQSFRVCLCFSRKFKLNAVDPPSEIKSLFEQYVDKPNGIMTADTLLRFLVEVQGEIDATKEDAEALIESFKHHHHIFTTRNKGLAFDSFLLYLFSDQNAPLLHKVHQDMDAPLSHYFIYTGHNSYLTGNQISSVCSDIPIIKALQKGVRVIELDMWPNSAKDDIDILHGRTLTTPVGLTKCLKSIKEYAFVKSEFPVILTLEDHLTPDLQAKVAELVVEIFGDTLFTSESERADKFPSPESLKRRIIISTKPPKEYLQSSSGKAGKDKEDEGLPKGGKDSSDDDSWGNELADLEKKLIDHQQQPDKVYQEDAEDDISYQDDGCVKISQSVTLAYKNLIAIHARARKGGLKEWFKLESDKVRRLSLREHVLEKAVVTHGKEIIRFTQDNLLRIFPKGSRLDSSNYNPLIGWMHGAQMVAFNMQGYGRSLWLMQGLFRGNGGCGYVKKPDFLLRKQPEDEMFDPRLTLPIKTTLKVKVYMGEGWYMDFRHTHFDTYSPPDFYTRVGIAGVPEDCVMKKTKIKEDEWSPVWDEEFEYKLTVPELALLRIEVHEYDVSGKDDFGGQTCLPVSELKTGIRSVPLHNRKGDKYNSVKLLMRFTFV